jgi:hypothetical protein
MSLLRFTPICRPGPLFSLKGHASAQRCTLHLVPFVIVLVLVGISRVHTFSALMCLAACQRLRLIADKLNKADRKVQPGALGTVL